MKKVLLFSAALIALSACGGSDEKASGAMNMEYSEADFAPAAMVQASEDMMERKMASPSPVPVPTDGATASTGPMLAYTHNRSIESPAKDVERVVTSHQKMCEKAGFQKCMVVNSNQNGIGEEWASANLHIRATPEWITEFFQDLPKDLKKTDSKITSASTSAQDLSTQIVDTDARLKAQLTLRDRLQALLTDRPSELGDLIELERELSRVQSDIDANASILAALRQRVAMSNLHMNYSAKSTVTSRSVWAPLADAFGNFFKNFAGALGAVVTAIAVIIPWLPVIGGLLWFGRWIYRKVWRKNKQEKAVLVDNASPAPTPPEANS
ncbi:DUF4349 domain-containing protein [Hirschia baltica]|uniref:DUF4349 domain-containing protein n=1 Tax=Hirschia baltica (strain ATCC 49814 / DSM 5838 / IFAM 1418) TaxID=582402 RepID=C6XPZ4_HIRBI|nr:DUF4349 domain-containing protein [Hirschia baltica]ACT58511.1 hypothetical protein Hbal_0817 [Hirschia baltica ATCC 49814]